MKKNLIVSIEIQIDALPEKIWKVLTYPKYIKQWDELPEDFGDSNLVLGTIIDWAGYSKLTVETYRKNEFLKLKLHSYSWKLSPDKYDISYKYKITSENDISILSIEIGDFSILENGQDYFNASVDFASESSRKIKNLSETE